MIKICLRDFFSFFGGFFVYFFGGVFVCGFLSLFFCVLSYSLRQFG